jgi:hypothetical protein
MTSVGLQIALVQQGKEKRRAALCVRPLIFAACGTVSRGTLLKIAGSAPALLQADDQIAGMNLVLHTCSHFRNNTISLARLSQWWCD